MIYDFDSYLLYEYTKNIAYTVRIKVTLKELVDSVILKKSAEKAFERFPYFHKKAILDENGGYRLEENDQPIVVSPESSKAPVLGGKEANDYFFSITYAGKDLYFNFSHSFCGACGAMFWVKSTIWQYLTDYTGEVISASGIKVPGTPLEEGETALPDLADCPDQKPLYTYDGDDSYYPLGDYLTYFINPLAKDQVYFPIEIDQKILMDYAKENDGTPNTIIAAIMFKAVSRIWESNRKVKQISARISENYRADVGCPNTYRDLIRQLHVKYDKKMKDWPVGKLSTLTRGRMFLQMEPEISWQEYQALLAFRNAIDEQKTHKKKCQYARKHSLLAHGITDSYTGSYVGQLDWGGLGQYIKAVHTIADGHLKIDVNAVDDKFFINFEQVNRDKKYLNAFFDVLTEEGIPFILGEMQDKRLPKLSL